MPTVIIGDNVGDDFAGTEDNEMHEANPTTNNGSRTFWYVSKDSSGDHRHTKLSFSGISNLPGALNVSGATLYFYQLAQGETVNITAKKLNRNWVEAEATWTIWSTGNNWTTAGALHEIDDRSSTVTFNVGVSAANSEYKALSAAQLAIDVEDFADGTLSNYGWHLEITGAGNSGEFRQFRSSEGTGGQKPYLSVTYTVPAGGIVVLRRRRM